MRILKKVLLYTTIIAVSLLAIMVVFGFIFQDRIVKQVITEVNKSLNSEIKVDKIEFSLISNFPYASVNLNEVTGFESKDYSTSPDSLFHFQTLSLSFSILDVIQSNFILQSITLTNGFVNLEINRKGVENYMIVKSDTSNESNFFLSLEEVNLEDCTVGYRDFRNQDAYNFFFPQMLATGTFSSTNITTALYGDTKINKLILDNTSYLINEYGKVDIGIEIDLEHNIFQISRGFVTLRDQYNFDVKGMSNQGKYAYTFKATKLDLRQAETLIPEKHTAFINSYELNGTANLEIELSKGKKAANPTIKGNFDLWNGDFINKETRESIKIPKAIGRFDMGKKAAPQTTQIWIERFELETPEGHARGKLALSNLKHPWFKLEATGENDLLELSKFYEFGDDFSMAGVADFDIKLTGVIHNIDSVTVADIKKFNMNAKVNLRNVALTIKNVPDITDLNASIILNHEILVVEKFDGIIAASKTTGIIQAKNWLMYALDQSENIEITTELNTAKFETSRWSSGSDTGNSKFSFPRNIKVQGRISANEFTHKDTYLQNFSAYVNYQPYLFKVSNASFDAFDGSFKTDFSMSQATTKVVYKCDLIIQNIDVQKFLEVYDNFGQTAVTHQQLRGDLSCKLKIGFESDRYLKVDNSSIILDGDFVILNGQMIENKLLTQIPSQIESNKVIALFVNLDAFEKRLHYIKFDTISNHISIENSVLTIPKMHVASSALQIDVSGTHSFSNEIDYYLSFNLKEVFAKEKKVKSEYGYIEDDELGNRMMFLHVYSKNGEVQIDLDKNGARKHRQSQSSEELNTAKTVLKEEFGFFDNDTTVKVTEAPVEFEYELDLGEFANDSSESQNSSDSVLTSSDSTKIKKKKKKSKKEEEFEEFDFEDDDY